jgi:hypothetical protein
VRVHHLTIDTNPHERAEPRLAGIEAVEPLLFEGLGEERLRRVFCFLWRQTPADAQILVDRLPVALHKIAKRFAPLGRLRRTQPLDDGVTRRREDRHAREFSG